MLSFILLYLFTYIMPVHSGHDSRGKYYQWGNQTKYHVADYGESGARKKAAEQGAAIRHSGYEEKGSTSIMSEKREDYDEEEGEVRGEQDTGPDEKALNTGSANVVNPSYTQEPKDPRAESERRKREYFDDLSKKYENH